MLDPNIPDWAKPTVKQMLDNKIETDPKTKVGDLPLYHLLAVVKKFVG
jgi:hypothetical protein